MMLGVEVPDQLEVSVIKVVFLLDKVVSNAPVLLTNSA